MAIINKTGIADGGLIQAEHVTRAIDALSGVSADSIVATGSFSGSLVGALTGTASFAETASFVTGSIFNGSNLATSASFSVSASQTISSSFATSASFALATNTSSLLITASATNNIITFTKGDASTFAITVDTGSGGTFDTTGLVTTASFNAYTGSNASQFAGTASFARTASFVTQLNQTVNVTGSLNINRHLSFISSSNIPAGAGGSAIFASSDGTPNAGRLFIGDGTGWQFHFSRRASNSTTDLITITDTGVIKLTDGDGSSYLFKKTNDSTNGTVIYTSRTDGSQDGSLRSDGWGNFSFNKSLAIGKEVAGGTDAARLDVNGNSVFTGSMTVTQNVTSSAILVTGSSAGTLMRIAQLGTGNAFVVEDATNDTSPFVINNLGNVAIGKTAPTVKLDVSGDANINGDLNITNGRLSIDTGNATTNLAALNIQNSDSKGFYVVTDIAGPFNYFNLSAAGDVGIIGSTGENLIIGAGNGAAWKFFGTNNTPEDGKMYTTANVGIAASNPVFKLHVGANSAAKPGGGSWSDTSDARLKENIELADLDLCYDVIKNLPLKRYRWKDNSYTDEQIIDRNVVGWIAQDVAAVFPKAVSEKPFTQVDGTTIDDCLTLNETLINRTLYGAVQKLITENETLKSELQLIKAHLGL